MEILFLRGSQPRFRSFLTYGYVKVMLHGPIRNDGF